MLKGLLGRRLGLEEANKLAYVCLDFMNLKQARFTQEEETFRVQIEFFTFCFLLFPIN